MNKLKVLALASLIGIISLFGFSEIGLCDIVSLDANYVAGQTDVIGKLNRDRIALTNGVNNIRGVYAGSVQTSGQVKAATIGNENLYDDASPRVYLNELFIQNLDDNNGLVASGLEFQTSTNLVSSATPGTAYTNGYRTTTASSTPHTFTASKWTYAFVCQDGSFDYLERNINVDITTSEYPTNCQPLSRVSTDTTQVLAVKDLRKTKFTFESYDSVYDEATESSLKNLLVAQTNPYRFGAMLKYLNASSFTVTAGAAMINSQARDRASYTSDASWGVATNAEDDGLDVGARANATYYVYLVADAEDQRPYTVVHSINSTAPTGKTNVLKIGEFYTNGGTISPDSVVAYAPGTSDTKFPGAQQIHDAYAIFDASSGTPAIKKTFNVSSITDNGAGDFTINLTNAFSSAYYNVYGMAAGQSAGNEGVFVNLKEGALPTANSFRIEVVNDANGRFDSTYVTVLASGI